MNLIILTSETAKELRIKLLKENNICPLCNEIIENPVLDHQHMTNKEIIGENGAGLVRGVLCNTCNAFLGKIENNYKRFKIKDIKLFLKNASKYLEQENLNYVYPSESKRLKKIFKKSIYNKLIKEITLNSKNKDINYHKSKIKYNKYITKTLEKLLIKYKIEF